MLNRLIRSARSSIHKENDNEDSSRTLWNLKIEDLQFTILDHKGSLTPRIIHRELMKDELGILKFRAQSRPTIIDIGANTGVISIIMANRFPDATIYAYEPVPRNFENLETNLQNNHVDNVKAFNLAVTADGRDLVMTCPMGHNSGGCTAQAQEALQQCPKTTVQSTTLDSIFEQNDLSRCDLLKIDCEGSEHEILESFQSISRIGYLIAEIHFNQTLKNQGYDRNSIDAVLIKLGRSNFQVKYINMCE